MPCDVNTRKNLRVIAFVLISAIVLCCVGVVISILSFVNISIHAKLFEFSYITDPPFLKIICGVVLGLIIVIILILGQMRKKICPDMELPFI